MERVSAGSEVSAAAQEDRSDLTVDSAQSVIDRPAYEHGITGGMSVMLGEIERLACEGEPENG
jgi:hypothetical protein